MINSKNLFVVATPFQLINALNYVLNSDKDESFDLLIRNRSRFMLNDNWKSEAKKLFDNIIIVKQMEGVGAFKRKILRMLQFTSPVLFLDLISDVPGIINQKNRYQNIFCSTAAGITPLIIRLNTSANVNYYDDGTGSYAGNSVTKENRIDRWLYRCIGKDDSRIESPNILYVNNPRLCTANFSKEIKALPPLNKTIQTYRSTMEGIFNKASINYTGYRMVYLDQPYGDQIHKKEMTRCRNEMLDAIGMDQLIYRLHPRSTRDSIVENHNNFVIDNTKYPWELICSDVINENYILIGDCSTAQIVPKWFFNKEPYILFLFQYARDYWSPDTIEVLEQIVEKTRSAYKNKDRVICVENPQELKKILEKIENHSY